MTERNAKIQPNACKSRAGLFVFGSLVCRILHVGRDCQQLGKLRELAGKSIQRFTGQRPRRLPVAGVFVTAFQRCLALRADLALLILWIRVFFVGNCPVKCHALQRHHDCSRVLSSLDGSVDQILHRQVKSFLAIDSVIGMGLRMLWRRYVHGATPFGDHEQYSRGVVP